MSRSRVIKMSLTGALLASLAIGAVGFLVLPRVQAASGSERVTKGDAEALLNAFRTGCGAQAAHGPMNESSPCGDRHQAFILFFPSFNGAHYCAADWHDMFYYSEESIDPTNPLLLTKQAVKNDLQANTASIAVDGSPLTLKSLPVKPEVGTPDTYYIVIGTTVSPDTLPAGTYTATLVGNDPASGPLAFTVTFTMDASGTGSCL